jgi:hypothetical protein
MPDSFWEGMGAIIALAGVLASIGFLWWQIRQLNRSLASTTYQEIVRMFDDFARLMIEYPALDAAIYPKPAGEPAESELAVRTRWGISIRFDWFESVAIQHRRYGILPDHIAEHWMNVLAHELESPALAAHWAECSHYYHPALSEAVEAARSRQMSAPGDAAPT